MLRFRKEQPAAGEVIEAGIIGQRHGASAASALDLTLESGCFDVANPVGAGPAVDVVMAVMPLTACVAPAPFRKGVRREDYLGGVGERSKNMRDILLADVLQKFARPDQIKGAFGNKRPLAKIVQNDVVGNDAIVDRLRAAVDSQNLATQIMKKLGRV